MAYKALAVDQLDRAIGPLKAIPRAIPRAGWLRAIRTALGMTAAQLGERLGVTFQAVLDTEKREPAGEVTLAQLRKVAEALNCDLYYALVPRVPFAEMVHERARKIANEEIEDLSHSMALEDQATDPAAKEKRIEAEIQRLLQGRRWSHLWR